MREVGRVTDDRIRRRPELARYVQQGFMIRTRADPALREGRAHHTARPESALASAPPPVRPAFPRGDAHPETGYVVQLPGNAAARPNPVTAP